MSSPAHLTGAENVKTGSEMVLETAVLGQKGYWKQQYWAQVMNTPLIICRSADDGEIQLTL